MRFAHRFDHGHLTKAWPATGRPEIEQYSLAAHGRKSDDDAVKIGQLEIWRGLPDPLFAYGEIWQFFHVAEPLRRRTIEFCGVKQDRPPGWRIGRVAASWVEHDLL